MFYNNCDTKRLMTPWKALNLAWNLEPYSFSNRISDACPYLGLEPKNLSKVNHFYPPTTTLIDTLLSITMPVFSRESIWLMITCTGEIKNDWKNMIHLQVWCISSTKRYLHT